MVRTLPPRRPVGYRRDGRPIYPIAGGSTDDEADEQLGEVVDVPQVKVSQDRLGKLLTREKQQGERAAIKRLLSSLGFETPKALAEYVASQREAEQSALTELEQREQVVQQREAEAAQRETVAAQQERAAVRRAVLVGLGATGQDLVDAERLLAVEDDADEARVAAEAEALRARRPELFGEVRTAVAAAPGGAPAGGSPTRTAPAVRPGAGGLDMARRRGLIVAD